MHEYDVPGKSLWAAVDAGVFILLESVVQVFTF